MVALSAAFTACAADESAILSIDSHCLAGKSPSRAAIARVIAKLDDGTEYKSPSGSFAARPSRELEQYGGAVVRVRGDRLPIPKTRAEAESKGYEATAIAIPDLGFGLNEKHRILFIGFTRRAKPTFERWTTQSSSDGENVCL